jgi:hypothetical protein
MTKAHSGGGWPVWFVSSFVLQNSVRRDTVKGTRVIRGFADFAGVSRASASPQFVKTWLSASARHLGLGLDDHVGAGKVDRHAILRGP